jgi:hypothetical protein
MSVGLAGFQKGMLPDDDLCRKASDTRCSSARIHMDGWELLSSADDEDRSAFLFIFLEKCIDLSWFYYETDF